MARPSEPFVAAWRSLALEPEERFGWRTISVGAAGSIAVHAGRCFPENQEAMLVQFPSLRISAAEVLPEGQGFAVERADPNGDGNSWLALTHKAFGGDDLFTAMVCDVANALDASVADGVSELKAMRSFIGRVRAWQEFMRKGASALSAESEIGLVGELTVLLSLMKAGISPLAAVEGWKGPMRKLNDFHLGTGAIEVKATIARIGFVARIMSLEQLDDATLQPLFLAAVRLEQGASGASLPDLVAEMRQELKSDPEAAQDFGGKLVAAGYINDHAPLYERRFEHVETTLVEVDAAFPRLIRASVPAGITQAQYQIDLDKVEGSAWDMALALKKLGAI